MDHRARGQAGLRARRRSRESPDGKNASDAQRAPEARGRGPRETEGAVSGSRWLFRLQSG